MISLAFMFWSLSVCHRRFLSNAEQVRDGVISAAAIVVHVGMEAVLPGDVGQAFRQAHVKLQRRRLLLMEHRSLARIPSRGCNDDAVPREVFGAGQRFMEGLVFRGTTVRLGQIHAADDIRIHLSPPENIDGRDQSPPPLPIAERLGLARADPVELFLVKDFQIGRVAQQAGLLIDPA